MTDSHTAKEYVVYILRCSDDTLYTGITTDVHARVAEHNAGKAAARYTRARRPVTLVYTETCGDRSAAQAREYAIKQLSRDAKRALIKNARS